MNLCIFRGNLTKDAELKYLPSGTAMMKFDLAVNYRYGKEDKTLFMKCTLFGKRAEGLASYLIKGTNVLVDGMLVENNWTGKDGRVNYSKELLVQNIEFTGCKKSSNQAQSRPQSQTTAAPVDDNYDDEIPF